MATTMTTTPGAKAILAPGTPAAYSGKKKKSSKKTTKKTNKRGKKSAKLVKGKSVKSKSPNLNSKGRKKSVLGGIDMIKGKISFN